MSSAGHAGHKRERDAVDVVDLVGDEDPRETPAPKRARTKKTEYARESPLCRSRCRTVMMAVKKSHPQCLEYLLDYGFPGRVNRAYGKHGVTPLWQAAYQVSNADDRVADAEYRAMVACVRILVDVGAEVNMPDDDLRLSPLAMVTEAPHNSSQLVSLLLSAGAEVEPPSSQKDECHEYLPLYRAVVNKQHKSVMLLMKAGARIDRVFPDGRTILHVAARESSLAVLKTLAVAHPQALERRDLMGRLPLHCVLGVHHYPRTRGEEVECFLMFKFMLQMGIASVHVASKDKNGKTLLHLAAAGFGEDDCLDEVARFLKMHVVHVTEWKTFVDEVEAGDRTAKRTALGVALDSRHGLDKARVLIRHGASMDRLAQVDGKYVSPIHYVMSETGYIDARSDLELFQFVLDNVDRKALNEPDRVHGATPIMTASMFPHRTGQLRMLHRAGADVHARDADGRTAIFYACRPALDILVDEFGLKLDAVSNDGSTILHSVVRRCSNSELVRLVQHLLKKCPALLGMRDAGGYSALHVAARRGMLDEVQLLLDAGADMESRTELGATPLFLALTHHHSDVARLLIHRGADPGSVDWGLCQLTEDAFRYGRLTILMAACEKGAILGGPKYDRALWRVVRRYMGDSWNGGVDLPDRTRELTYLLPVGPIDDRAPACVARATAHPRGTFCPRASSFF